MAVPILFGAATGGLAPALGVAFGSLLLGGVGAFGSWRAQGAALIAALVPRWPRPSLLLPQSVTDG